VCDHVIKAIACTRTTVKNTERGGVEVEPGMNVFAKANTVHKCCDQLVILRLGLDHLSVCKGKLVVGKVDGLLFALLRLRCLDGTSRRLKTVR